MEGASPGALPADDFIPIPNDESRVEEQKKNEDGSSNAFDFPEENKENQVSLDSAIDDEKSKKIKLDSKADEEDLNISSDFGLNCSDEETSCEKALRNPVIQRNMFKYVPTGFLLSSCSLVNKTWNKGARIFIRNNRKCVARNPDRESASVCRVIQNLHGLCYQMKEQGLEIPYNGLKLYLPWSVEKCPEDACCAGLVHVDLPKEMTLKYLDVASWSSAVYPRDEDPRTFLIRNHASEIQYLTTDVMHFLRELVIPDKPRCFAHLEELCLKAFSYDQSLENILRNLRSKSPNLKKIFIQSSSTLRNIPEELYGLVGNLEILPYGVFMDEYPFQQVASKNPQLVKLDVYETTEGDNEQLGGYSQLIQRLLQSSEKSLSELLLGINGFRILSLLSNNALKNLSSLSLEILEIDCLEELWDVVSSIESDKMMPKLEEMKIWHETGISRDLREWPPDNSTGVFRCSKVRTLALTLTNVRCNMHGIKAAFPNVTSLDLKFLHTERIPCQELWELWPGLEELKVEGVSETLRQNYDAEFCGIYEEEAELLRGQDEEFLKLVQIVPIRPCLLTMLNLRSYDFRPTFSHVAVSTNSEQSLDIISNVTRQVALRGLPSNCRHAIITSIDESDYEQDSGSEENVEEEFNEYEDVSEFDEDDDGNDDDDDDDDRSGDEEGNGSDFDDDDDGSEDVEAESSGDDDVEPSVDYYEDNN